ncbi:MAG TPA: hypothetical protein VIK33_17080 [Anaerolineae bacterium]
MDATQFLILAGAILIGAVLILGGVVLALRSRRSSVPRENDPFAPPQVETPFPAAPAEPTPARAAPSRMNGWQRKLPPDVVALTRDAATGEWLVEIEGQRYNRLSDIHDDKAATKILSAIEGLKVFAGIAPAAPPEASPAVPAPSTPPLPPLVPGARKLRQAQYPAPEGSIIAQIETILQRELSLRSELSDRTIHMGATPDGSLLIEVDLNFYRSPDEMPDPAVRDVVMSAVHIWEKSG